MDSPIRKQQKRNDYLRHKLFRKISRRRKAEKELALKAPEKELKRRFRKPKYDDGKNIVYETQNTEDGTVYRVKPSAFGAKELNVTTPDVVVTARDPRKPISSAYHPEDVEEFFNLSGAGMLFNPFRLARTSNLLLTQPSLSNTAEVATDVLPWSKSGRFLLGTYGLANKDGLLKTWDLVANQGRYGRAALSAIGDVLNALMVAEGAPTIYKLFTKMANRLFPKPNLNVPPMGGKLEIPNQDAGLYQTSFNVEQPVPELVSLTRKRNNYIKPKSDISSKNFNDIVKEDGSVDKEAFERAILVYSKLSSDVPSNTLDDFVGSDVIRNHLYNVVKSAQDAPTPIGFTKREQVGAALLHDIGKIYGNSSHGESAWRMLYPGLDSNGRLTNSFRNQAFTNVPESVRLVVRHHMSKETFGSENQLLRATLFADVARGLPYDQAALKFPHLMYKSSNTMSPKYKDIPLREEIKKYINPWLKDNGYGPQDKNGKFTGIPLNATEEEAWSIVQDAVAQHNRVLRGSRLSTGSTSMNSETQRKLAEVRETSLRELIKDRPITDEDRVIWENEHINGTPTGYGRLGVFDNHMALEGKGLSYNTHGPASRNYKIDPNSYDVKYTSMSDEVSDHYASSGNNRDNVQGVMLIANKKLRLPGMSMREYIASNDWDLYSGESVNPIGIYNMLEVPFRLLTGKSLLYESQKGLKKPMRNKPAIKSDDYEYNDVSAQINDINNIVDDFPEINFKIKLGKNKEIFYPEQVSVLHRDLKELQSIKKTISKADDIMKYFDERGGTKRIMGDIDILNQLNFFPHLDDVPPELLATRAAESDLANIIIRLANYNMISLKEQNILLKQMHSGRWDAIFKYLNKKGLMNSDEFGKNYIKKAINCYFDDIKKYSRPDIREYIALSRDPERLMQIVRENGVVPRFEMPDFNERMAIATSHALRRKYSYKHKLVKPERDKINQQLAFVGKFGERVLETEEYKTNIASGKAAGPGKRDYGKRSNKKLSHKTLAEFGLPITIGASTIYGSNN